MLLSLAFPNDIKAEIEQDAIPKPSGGGGGGGGAFIRRGQGRMNFSREGGAFLREELV